MNVIDVTPRPAAVSCDCAVSAEPGDDDPRDSFHSDCA